MLESLLQSFVIITREGLEALLIIAAIIAYLEKTVLTESVGDYLQDVRDELVELFTGREDPRSEMRGLGKVLYLLQLRFGIEHPALAALLRRLPD